MSDWQKTVPTPDSDALEFGFIVPGHGIKGRKEWLYRDEDFQDMIEVHNGSSITLWCYNCKKSDARSKFSTPSNSTSKQESRLRSRSPHRTKCSKSKDRSTSTAKTSGRGQYESQMKKMEAVDEIYKRLGEKFRGKYTPEQLRAWAHMIDLKKHSSYDEPPNKPLCW